MLILKLRIGTETNNGRKGGCQNQNALLSTPARAGFSLMQGPQAIHLCEECTTVFL